MAFSFGAPAPATAGGFSFGGGGAAPAPATATSSSLFGGGGGGGGLFGAPGKPYQFTVDLRCMTIRVARGLHGNNDLYSVINNYHRLTHTSFFIFNCLPH